MTRIINKVSNEAVLGATGRSWDQWIRLIDRRGGAGMDHKAIVALLAGPGKVASGWWRQMVAVGYEHAKGRRKTGETADAGFQVGIQKAVPMGRGPLWRLLTGGEGLRLWLGSVRGLALEPGARYRTGAGISGEIRAVKAGQRIRLTWRPKGRAGDTTLQLTLSCPRNTRGRTTVRFHHERLADGKERERMRARWSRVLEKVAALAAGGGS